MKLLTALLFLAVTAIVASPQNPIARPEPATKIEQFSERSGRLIQKEFIDIGVVKTVDVQVLRLTDLIDGTTTSGVRLSYTASNDVKTAFLDADEVDGLIKSIAALKNAFTTQKATYTEIVFVSRGGFRAGAYFSPAGSKWTTFIRLERFDTRSSVFMATEDFDKLASLLETGKAQLK